MDRGVAVLFLDTEYAKTCDRSTEEDCARGSKEAPAGRKTNRNHYTTAVAMVQGAAPAVVGLQPPTIYKVGAPKQ